MKILGIILGALGTVLLFFVHWIVGLFLIVTAIILLLIPKSQESQGATKKCPQCAELVKEEALICRFCNFTFPKPPIRQLTEKEILINRLEDMRQEFNALASKKPFGEEEKQRRKELEKEMRKIRGTLYDFHGYLG
jgi:hypothetical protein